MPFGQISHVLLDAVGTLIYPSPSVGEVYQQAAAAQGLILPLPDVKGRFLRRIIRSPIPHSLLAMLRIAFAGNKSSAPSFQNLLLLLSVLPLRHCGIILSSPPRGNFLKTPSRFCSDYKVVSIPPPLHRTSMRGFIQSCRGIPNSPGFPTVSSLPKSVLPSLTPHFLRLLLNSLE